MRSFPTEYFILTHVAADGPAAGYLGSLPIAARIRDQWGQRYVYCGLAPRRANGAFNLDLVQAGEWIVEPGLLYRRDEGTGGEGRRSAEIRL